MTLNSPENNNNIENRIAKIAESKIRDPFKGDLGLHFTQRDNIPSLVSGGILSQNTARAKGIPITSEWTGRSNPDQVYFYTQRPDPDENRSFLSIYGSPTNPIFGGKNIVFLFTLNNTQPIDADPKFPDSSTTDVQKMLPNQVPIENNVGLMVIAGGKTYDDPEIQQHVKLAIEACRQAGFQNPELAIPIYDQEGNVIWPSAISYNELKNLKK